MPGGVGMRSDQHSIGMLIGMSQSSNLADMSIGAFIRSVMLGMDLNSDLGALTGITDRIYQGMLCALVLSTFVLYCLGLVTGMVALATCACMLNGARTMGNVREEETRRLD